VSKTIWKFPLEAKDTQEILMPMGAKILTVATQGDIACIWAEVDPEATKEARGFYIVGTGFPLSWERGNYIGTFQLLGGGLVFHVYEYKP